MTSLFHLAVPVHELPAAEHFYGEVLGLERGRESDHWIDWDLGGHQIVTHVVGERSTPAGYSMVGDHEVPVPHFGLVLDLESFHALAGRLRDAGHEFVIEPTLRFEGEPGEQWTMFFLDESGNAMEFKAFADVSQLFAV
ncbi:VOC family protein [Jatrophihabitans sp. YIM 134969]